MTDTLYELPPTATEALAAARADLAGHIEVLDEKEIATRDELDLILGRRTRFKAALADLDNLLSHHTPPDAIEVNVTPTPLAERAAAEIRNMIPTPTPTPARQAVPAGRLRGGRPKKDYTEIAAWINAAKASGSYSQQALAGRFDVDITTAKNWVTRCRKLGLIGGEADKPAKMKKPTSADQLVRVPVADAVAADFKPGQPRLECDDCDAAFQVHQSEQLVTHTLREHGRAPRRAERTPRTGA